ncbi:MULTISPECIES: hypothetical protein [unclassified Endozoicomonas]|uniref:hypothetical protein n=1 Tax=unclassified Endozoicomonas TaxID=2644528 RepID=UPI003BB64BBD
MQNIENTSAPPFYPQPDPEECNTQRCSEGLEDIGSTTAINPESQFQSSDQSNDPAYCKPSGFPLSERQAAIRSVEQKYHTPDLTSAIDQGQPEQSSACLSPLEVLLGPLPDDIILDTLPCFHKAPSSPSEEITIEDVQNFRQELLKFQMKLDQEFFDRKFLDTDALQFHSLIYNRLALLKRLANKYQVLKESSYKIVDWFNTIKLADKSQYVLLSKQLFLSDDMSNVTRQLVQNYRVLGKMLCLWSPKDTSPGQQSISFLSESIVCHLSCIYSFVESMIRHADFRRNIALRAPVEPKIRKHHSILHAPPRKRSNSVASESRRLSEGISNLLTTVASATLEIQSKKDSQDIVKIASGCLFSSIDRYRNEGYDQEFQPVCVDKKMIAQHLFCAELFHAALMSERWDVINKVCETTSRIVFHNDYSLEKVIQGLKKDNTKGINIESWHDGLNEYSQTRCYPLNRYFELGIEASSIYLSTLLAHKESVTENQSPLIKIKKTEELQHIFNVLSPWATQLQELGLLTNEAVESCKYHHRLSLAKLRIQTLTNNHEVAIRNSFNEVKKVIVQGTATDGITNDNPQQLPESLKSLLAETLIQNNDILKLINKECDIYNPGINITELDRKSCEWLINIFANIAQSPHSELLLTFSHCSYYCAMLIEHICECASIFSDLEGCITSIQTSDPSSSLKETKEKWKEKIKANASGIKEKIDQFDKINQNIQTCFRDAFRQLNKIREQVITGQDKCLKIVLFESIKATLYHGLRQLQHLNTGLVTVSSKRIDILKSEFPTIANLEQATVSCRKKINKNIAFIAGCVKDLDNSKELSLVKITGNNEPNPVHFKNGRFNKQASKKPDTLANFVVNTFFRVDTRETLETRAYFHEQIASEVQALNHNNKPVVYLGSRAYQTQVQSRWGSQALKRVTGSDLLPGEISREIIERSVTPRDTDLLVLNKEQFSEIIGRLYNRLEEAARAGGYLPEKCVLLKTKVGEELYYGKKCFFCNLILRLKEGYTKKDWVYVVDLITPMDSGPSTLLPYDSPELASGSPTLARPLTSIMIDELNLAVGQAAGPARALMAMMRINVLAALESSEPKLDSISGIVLMHVVERLQDSYPDPALDKMASILRSRAFNRVAYEEIPVPDPDVSTA